MSDDGFGVHFAPNGELARPKDDGDGPAIHTTSIIVREAASPVNFLFAATVLALPIVTHRRARS